MPNWLAQNPIGAYFVCAALGLIFLVAFWTTRRAKFLAGVAGAVLLAGGVFLIDWLIETDQEQIERKLNEMADAVNRGDVERLKDFFDDNFKSDQFPSRTRLLDDARRYLKAGENRKVNLWAPDIKFSRKTRLTCICQYSAQGMFAGRELPPQLGKLELVYVKDANGQWRIESFHVQTMQGERRNIPRG
jgi:hypothetical protein